MPLQIRRGTDAERTAMTQPLAAGELIFVTNTNKLYIGNGTVLGGIPVTEYTDEQARDASAAMFVTGTHNSITFAYDDALNKVNATVNLSDYQGVIKAAAFNGSVVANDSSLLIDGNTGKFNLSGSIGTDIIPDTNIAYDLGSPTFRFRDLYLSGSSIKLGDATITSTGTAVNLPAGSTIGGSSIGMPGGDLNVNIVANDSTVIVNTTTEVVTAQGGFLGNLTGNVTGNATSVTNGVYITDTGTVTNTMLATINTAGKVSNSATTATDANTASAIVARDLSGNFSASTIFANIDGDITGSVFADNSSLLVDGTNGTIVGPIVNNTISTGTITFNQDLAAGGIFIQTQGSLEDNYDLFVVASAHNDTDSSGMVFSRSRGTIAAPTALNTDDRIFSFLFGGQSSTTAELTARLTVQLDGSVGSGTVPGKFVISTANSAGVMTDRLTVDSKGISAFTGMVQLPTFANEAAANASVTTPVNGMMYYDSGASKVKARQGGAWVVLA